MTTLDLLERLKDQLSTPPPEKMFRFDGTMDDFRKALDEAGVRTANDYEARNLTICGLSVFDYGSFVLIAEPGALDRAMARFMSRSLSDIGFKP